MAMRFNCCVNFYPPSFGSLQFSPQTKKMPKTKPQFTSTREAEEIKLRKNRYGSVFGVACIVMGVVQLRNSEGAAAFPAPAPETSELVRINSEGNHEEGGGIRRWSEKRGCPSWRVNSFETIVPENLPRPSAKRRWEAVGISGLNDAPSVKDVVRPAGKAGCFSM